MLPLLVRLAQQYPGLSIDVRFADDYVDLVKEGIDVAIRTGTLRDSMLVARPFGVQELLFASPSYLAHAGTPTTMAELTSDTAVLFRVSSTGKNRPWHFRLRGRNVTFMPPSWLRVDDGDAIARAAVLGMRIGQLPYYVVTESLARGELVSFFPRCDHRQCLSPR